MALKIKDVDGTSPYVAEFEDKHKDNPRRHLLTPTLKADRDLARSKLNEFGIEAFCEMIVNGASLRLISETIGVYAGAIILWLCEDAERSALALRARGQTGWIWDEAALNVLIDAPRDGIEMQRAKEMSHHYRWRAAKMTPKLYGEHASVDHKIEVSVLPPEQRQARIEQLQAKLLGVAPAAMKIEGKTIEQEDEGG